MTNRRIERIDNAICAAGQLIGTLLEVGPLNSEQKGLIVQATVRAAVPNAELLEIRESVQRIVTDLGRHHGRKDQLEDQLGDQ
jgi:hypothetical protein